MKEQTLQNSVTNTEKKQVVAKGEAELEEKRNWWEKSLNPVIVSIYKIMTIEISLYCLTSLQLLSGCTEHKQNLKNYEN